MALMQSEADNIVPLSNKDAYKDAGVDTREADAGLRRLVQHIVGTWPPRSGEGGVQLDIGYFANVINFCGQGLAICTDGAGSKTVIAQMMKKYDTIGIDCVAMNVNDLICIGARPVSMVDYIAVQEIDASMLEEISVGLSEGARLSRISIPGGEIAQLKDIVNGFDIVGMAVGHVALDRIITGKHIKEGDILMGIGSNGVHSNGLSLARRVFFELHGFAISHKFDELQENLGVELLRPTCIYVNEVLDMLNEIESVGALVHITSDGFLNLARVEAEVGFVIDALPPVPPIFSLIQKLGRIEDAVMFEVYNMGVGFAVVVDPADEEKVKSIVERHGKHAYKIGYVVSDPRKRVWLEKERLVGENKKFSQS